MIYIYNKKECDPKKCTALKLGRLGLANIVYTIGRMPAGSLLLYPFSDKLLSPPDRSIVLSRGISAVDCSWNRIEPFPQSSRFEPRKLPFLLAANPTNYAMPFKLSTLEALVATLYVTGFIDDALALSSKVKWGETFLTLNREPLSLYSTACDLEEVTRISSDYAKQYNI